MDRVSIGIAAGVGAGSIAPNAPRPSGTCRLSESLVCTGPVRGLGAVIGKKPGASGLSVVNLVVGGWWEGGLPSP